MPRRKAADSDKNRELLESCESALMRKDFEAAAKGYEKFLAQGLDNDGLHLDALLGSSRAYVGLSRYAKALDKAEAAVALRPDSAKALLQCGQCEDALALHVSAAETLATAISLCEETGAEADVLAECKRVREIALRHVREMEHGDFAWSELYAKDAGNPVSVSDGGPTSFCHPSVQVQKVAGKGRGLVLTDAVAESELLFVCRAFALAPKDKLQQVIIDKLGRCSRTEFDRFLCVYDGENSSIDVSEELNIRMRPSNSAPGSEVGPPDNATVKRVEQVLKFSTHARDSLNMHGASEEINECGVWFLASFINHACRPNVQRTFLGDLMICRAAQPLSAGTELLDTYVSPFQSLNARKIRLKTDFDFHCCCPRCQLEECAPSLAQAIDKSLMQLDELVEQLQKGKSSLNESARALDQLAEDALGDANRAAKAVSSKVESNHSLRAACKQLWDSDHHRLEKLFAGPFVAVLKGAAFARKQTNEPKLCAKGYQRCLEVLEETSPGSAYHAHWSAERALQAHSIGEGVVAAARYAYRWHSVCYGQQACKPLLEQLGWPPELLASALPVKSMLDESTFTATPSVAADADKTNNGSPHVDNSQRVAGQASQSVSTSSPWEWNLEDQECALVVSIVVPDGLEPSDLELDVGKEHVRITCQAASGTALDALHVHLPRRVDPDRAPPAKYKKKGRRRLVLELPCHLSGTTG